MATKIPLFLLSAVVCASGACPPHFLEIQWKLRFAKGINALEMLHKYLLSWTAIVKYKVDHTHGHYEGSCSSKVLTTVNAKIGACIAKYRIHQTVILELAGPCYLNLVRMDAVFKVLQDKDVCRINRDAMDTNLEGNVTLSWIWVNEGIDPNDQETINEFSHSQAYELLGANLKPEPIAGKRRVSVFMAQDWECKSQAGALVHSNEACEQNQARYLLDNEEFAQGWVAYAHKQPTIQRKMHDFCAGRWAPALEKLTTGVGTCFGEADNKSGHSFNNRQKVDFCMIVEFPFCSEQSAWRTHSGDQIGRVSANRVELNGTGQLILGDGDPTDS
ncbi:hypothetical protein GYMLUDRAFT_62671 [Collybiopsis luxurians FD-317 M1]|uniref:Uncharacterized protein n=1 Tax=Collybiopsis luxurians FD-317 M1 TaxID=944289 RepID=A0A0D0CJM6_9AGAR|nr:hypothetical protein GYMLUDRAFT_62671 [Collybiopsis luxurians FD-317 M1]